MAFDHRPDPLAGLKIDDEDLEKLLTELPGLAIADRSLIGAIEREARPAVEQARAQLRSVITKTSSQTISGNDTFSRIVRFARLSELETEVLALACSVELDPRRQRVVGYLNDDVSQRRLSLFTLQLLLPEHPDVGLAISPGGGLRRAALLAPAEPGVLGSVALAPSPTVFWWLAGDRTRDPELPAGSEHIAAGGDPALFGPALFGPALFGSAKPGPGAHETGRDRLVLVPGSDKLRRRQAAIAALGPLLASPLPASPPAWDAVVRQATLEQSAVMIELDGPLPAEARQRIEQADHLNWALASSDELPLDCLPSVAWKEMPVALAPATDLEWEAAVASLAALGPWGLKLRARRTVLSSATMASVLSSSSWYV